MNKSITFIIILFVTVCSFGQNYNSLYTYESINGIEEKESEKEKIVEVDELKDDVLSLSELMKTEEGQSIEKRFRKNSVVITKGKAQILIRFNGDYSSLQLVDFKGNEIEADYHSGYKGLILPVVEKGTKFFLKTKNSLGKTSYHRVNL